MALLCKLKKINELNVSGCGITDDGTSVLEKTQIELLSLSDATITDKTIPHLIRMPKLNRLNLGTETTITATGEKKLQTAKPSLKLRHGVIVKAKIEDALNVGIEELKDLDPDFFSSAAEQIDGPKKAK